MSWNQHKQLLIDWALVQKDFDKLQGPDQRRVKQNVERFAEHGVGDVAKMMGSSDPTEWRLKFKPWRVIFAIDTQGVMRLLIIDQRKDAYR